MTNESISGFLNSIAEAKRAFDQEPVYIRQIQDLEADKKRLGDTVAHRELRIHELKQNEETLTQKLRSVEAERDDAGFRALEEADKVQNLLSVVQRFITDGLAAVSAVEGTVRTVVTQSALDGLADETRFWKGKALDTEAELQRLQDDMRQAQEQLQRPFNPEGGDTSSSAEGTTDHSLHDTEAEALAAKPYEWPKAEGQRAADPTASTTQAVPSPSVHSVVNPDTAPIPTTAQVEGQSDGPFAAQENIQSTPATSGSAENETSVASHASPPERNRDRSTFFKDRKYFDVTYFVPLHQWLNEGGAREDYYWRPAEANVPLPQPNRASHNS